MIKLHSQKNNRITKKSISVICKTLVYSSPYTYQYSHRKKPKYKIDRKQSKTR